VETRPEEPKTKPGSGGLSAREASRFLGTLEPAHIRTRFRESVSRLLGPCEVRVFIFVQDDRSQMLPFGPDEDEPSRDPAEPASAPGQERVRLTLDDGRERWSALLPPRDEGAAPSGFVEVTFARPLEGSGPDLLKELTDSLAVAVGNALDFDKTRRLTFTDDLTALYNSRFMSLYLDREIKRCRRTRSPLSLLFMDLDGFKNVNDTHGHLAGSRTLVEVGEVLEQTVRDADILIRYGGDEFVILFPETSLSGGVVIAERIRQVIESTKFLKSQNIEARISASIGIAAYPETADDVRGLISSADRAMYQAKTLGKDRVVVATPVTAPSNPSLPNPS